VYSMVQRREKEKDSRYIQEASAPAAEPYIRLVTCLRHKYTCNSLSCINRSQLSYGIRADGVQPSLYIDEYVRIRTWTTVIYGLYGLLDSTIKLFYLYI
jgi:hypothetical protein